MKTFRLNLIAAAFIVTGVSGCNSDGIDVYDQTSKESKIALPFDLYPFEAVLSENQNLIRDEYGRILVKLTESGEVVFIEVDSDNVPIRNSAGEVTFFPASHPIIDNEGYLVDTEGNRILTTGGLLLKPSRDNDGNILFDSKGNVVVDTHTTDGTLVANKANTLDTESAELTGNGPDVLVVPGHSLTDLDGNPVLVDDGGEQWALRPIVDESGALVTSPDGNLVVDLIDPDTGKPSGDKGELTIDEDNNPTIGPLPPVLVNDQGYLVDRDGNLVTNDQNQSFKPTYTDSGELVTDTNGNVVVDVYSPNGDLVSENGATVAVDDSGVASVKPAPGLLLGDRLTDLSGNPITYGPDGYQLRPMNHAAGITTDINGDVLLEVVDHSGNPTGELLVVKTDDNGKPMAHPDGSPILKEPGLIVDSQGYLVSPEGSRFSTSDGLWIKPSRNEDGSVLFDQQGNVIVDTYHRDGTLSEARADSYNQSEGTLSGRKPGSIALPEHPITDLEGDAIRVDVDGEAHEVVPVTDENGNFVHSPDGNLIVDVIDPNTGETTGDKGELVFDKNGNATLNPLPDVLVNDEGYLVDGNGDLVTNDQGQKFKPTYNDNGELITDADGNPVLDVYSANDDLVTANGATATMGNDGSVSIGTAPGFIIEPGQPITDGNGDNLEVTVDGEQQEVEAVTDDNGDLISSPDGNPIVDVIDPDTGEATGDKGELVVDENGNATLEPLPAVLINDDGYLIDGNGDLVTNDQGQKFKPTYNDSGELITDADGNPILDVYNANDELVTANGATATMGNDGSVTIGTAPDLIIEPGQPITDSNGDNLEVSVGGEQQEVEAVTDDNGDLVTSPDGNLIVDVIDPDTGAATGDKGELVVDENGNATLNPLPDVLVNEDGYLIDGNGDLVTNDSNQQFRPTYTNEGELVTDASGNLVVDVYDRFGDLVSANGATVSMGENGTASVSTAPDFLVGDRLTDASGDAITLGPEGYELRPIDSSETGIDRDINGNLLLEVVDNQGNPTGAVKVVQTDSNGNPVTDASGDPALVKPGLIVNEDNDVVDAYGAVLTSGNGNDIALQLDTNGMPVRTKDGYSITQVDAVTGQPVSNTIFINPNTGEMWTDADGKPYTQKSIPAADYASDSLPSVNSVANTFVGFMDTKSNAPIITHAVPNQQSYPYQWVFTKDGRILFFGSTPFLIHPNRSEVGFFDANGQMQTTLSDDVMPYYYIGEGCNRFDPSISMSYLNKLKEGTYSYSELVSDVEANPSLACLPQNVRAIAITAYKGLSGLLTKDNKLWGIGFGEHGLGGFSGSWKMPRLWMEDVKLTTGPSTPRYTRYTMILKNNGEVYRAEGDELIKYATPEDDTIINVTNAGYYSATFFPIGVSVSGNYYRLRTNGYEKITLPEDFNTVVSFTEISEERVMIYMDKNRQLKRYVIRTAEVSNITRALSSTDNGTSKQNLNYISLSEDLTFEVISPLLYFRNATLDNGPLLKGSDGEYYSLVPNTNIFNSGANVWKKHNKENDADVENLSKWGPIDVLIRLDPENTPLVKFIHDRAAFGETWEFTSTSQKMLYNARDKKLAVFRIDEGNMYASQGYVAILPDRLTEQVLID
ncbi:autotransporter adhesin family protein [Marinobacter hydrocarbonoclasticus]|nr:autotransporter adhesin family protein [Marinobacter nauticus]